MAAETTILRAYALACQCKYAEAEQLIASDPDALNLPHGADLYARILYAGGRVDSARRVWERLLRCVPDYEPAKKALAADETSILFSPHGLTGATRMRKMVLAGIAAAAIAISFSIGKSWQTAAVVSPPRGPIPIIAETSIKETSIDRTALNALKEGFLTNLTDEAVLVIRGGSGRHAADRQRRLAVIAECIKYAVGTPLSRTYFQPGSESSENITLQIVPAFRGRKEREK